MKVKDRIDFSIPLLPFLYSIFPSMNPPSESNDIAKRVVQLEKERDALRLEVEALRLERDQRISHSTKPETSFEKVAKLSNPEIARYGRQLILPEFGIKGK